ncbi:MAG: HNH endonuclease [Actinomycetota bacterium]|nr:HNH endonuclease [Actinomycetota bacterium]MDQ3350870.1 HNH endonuclease [Actinomycetota bacterium]
MQGHALVLNVTYEPLGVVASLRALCLVIAAKAEVVEEDERPVLSVDHAYPRPLVVKLRYMVHVPYRHATALSRRAVFVRDDHTCQYCGRHADSIDHVLPRSRGGEHIWENVAAACRRCNTVKRDRTPDEAGMRLARPCHAPRHASWVSFCPGHVPEAWKPYLAPDTLAS